MVGVEPAVESEGCQRCPGSANGEKEIRQDGRGSLSQRAPGLCSAAGAWPHPGEGVDRAELFRPEAAPAGLSAYATAGGGPVCAGRSGPHPAALARGGGPGPGSRPDHPFALWRGGPRRQRRDGKRGSVLAAKRDPPAAGLVGAKPGRPHGARGRRLAPKCSSSSDSSASVSRSRGTPLSCSCASWGWAPMEPPRKILAASAI